MAIEKKKTSTRIIKFTKKVIKAIVNYDNKKKPDKNNPVRSNQGKKN